MEGWLPMAARAQMLKPASRASRRRKAEWLPRVRRVAGLRHAASRASRPPRVNPLCGAAKERPIGLCCGAASETDRSSVQGQAGGFEGKGDIRAGARDHPVHRSIP